MPATLEQPKQPVDKALLEDVILPNVFKPGRYLGMEQGAYRKPFEKAKVSMAIAFPDLYEIGASNYALKLFYSLINQQKDYMCDRVYAPAPDMREKLADFDMPLYGVESLQPVKNFDVVAFTLPYELNTTTILGLMESAQIPIRREDRMDMPFPLILGGGNGSANPMPLAPFFDAFIIGDGEEVLIEILELTETLKKKNASKQECLEALDELDGLYVPGVSDRADKRIVDIEEHQVDMAPLTPVIDTVHNRITIEARRGCDRMCRFCQPCFINLPVREQNIEAIKKQALSELEKTGYEECSLLSLSIADYSFFKPLVLEVADALAEKGISLSLPSQRADRFSIDVAEAVQSVRKSTLTFAPEAGTMRLRDVINKNLTDEEITNAVVSAYKTGWNKVKLYFIIGLPTETLDDLDGIVDTVKMLQDECRKIKRDQTLSIKKHLEVNVTLSNFVPKPHTPFQWFPQDTMETLYSKIKYLKEKLRELPGVKANFTDPEISKLEAVISKGGEELSEVLELAYRKGAYLDAWDDISNFQKWFDALREKGIDYEAYTRERCVDPDEDLPWDPIDMGLNKSWLKEEYQKAKEQESTVPCFEECSTCGVCANYGTWPKFTEEPLEMSKYNHPQKKKVDNRVENPHGNKKHDAIKLNPVHAKEPVGTVRLKLEKRGKMRFISHLDWLRILYRAFSQANLPIAYTQGFNPKPKMAFSPALPLFCESEGEYIDVMMTEPVTDVTERLNAFLPSEGKALEELWVDGRVESIDKSITTLSYKARIFDLQNHGQEANPDASSTVQTTCKNPIKEYTVNDRVRSIQEQINRGDAISIEIEKKPSRSKRKFRRKSNEQPSKQVLNLTPFIKSLETDSNGTVYFTIQKQSKTNPEETEKDLEQKNKNNTQLIKPLWVLSLIEPDANWLLTRTDITLQS